jgi:hypothetical protein
VSAMSLYETQGVTMITIGTAGRHGYFRWATVVCGTARAGVPPRNLSIHPVRLCRVVSQLVQLHYRHELSAAEPNPTLSLAAKPFIFRTPF